MKRYAEGTRVPVNQTRAEIERTLARYGATGFLHGWDGDVAMIGFRMAAKKGNAQAPEPRHVKFILKMPQRRSEQIERQRWRALLLVIKAKLEAVASGITEFDDEFLANIVMPDGGTVGDHLRGQIESAYKTGKMPPLLGFREN